ncbi:MAG: response regulator [Candidatus Omnitrophica bacterium]|nr:response regulator [Candidatus Omnitrophota bacterium]
MAKRILVVDDEPDILKVVVFRLKKLGYEIISAATGREALELVKAGKPDLILLDYRLPDMDGLEISKKIRADKELKDTPIILLSASSGEDISLAIKAANVNDYVKKPFDLEELLDKVKRHLL